MKNPKCLALALLLVAIGWAPLANAQEKSNPGPVPRIINGTPTNGFESVGLVGDAIFGFYCTGTLISSRHVLTAAHCAEGVSGSLGRFRVGGRTYSSECIFIHEGYNGSTLENDIAILRLDEDVRGITPSPINRTVPEVDQELILVGYGAGGDCDGHDGTFGIKRYGVTTIDAVLPKQISWRFNSPDESNTAPGDSGGPNFVNIEGELRVAGITSWGTRPDAGCGDTSFSTRVDAYADWIDSVLAGEVPCCPLETSLKMFLLLAGSDADPGAVLATVRQFRDRVMQDNENGRSLIVLYYRHGEEIKRIMAEHPRLGLETLRVVLSALPALEASKKSGGLVTLDADLYVRGLALVDRYQDHADGALKDALASVRSLLVAKTEVSAGKATIWLRGTVPDRSAGNLCLSAAQVGLPILAAEADPGHPGSQILVGR